MQTSLPPLPSISTGGALAFRQTNAVPHSNSLKASLNQNTTASSSTQVPSSTTVKIQGLASPLRSKFVAPGMGADQFNSMLQTSLKMKTIRGDPTIPEDAKRKMLAPLEQANKNILTIADAKAEQKEKSEMMEAASEDSDEIQRAGKEIAAEAERKNMAQADSLGSAISLDMDEANSASMASTVNAVVQVSAFGSDPLVVASSPVYSDSASVSAVGGNVDTQA